MPTYLVHSSRERARIRHLALALPETQAKVFEFLKAQSEVAGVKPGRNSFLLLLTPQADIEAVCRNMETQFPFFNSHVAPKNVTACAMRMNWRHVRNMTLLTFGLATVGLALTGLKHAHVWAGCIFTLLATDHVWKHRKAL